MQNMSASLGRFGLLSGNATNVSRQGHGLAGDPQFPGSSRYWVEEKPAKGADMRSQNPPTLTLVVPSNVSRERTWILEPQGRNTFKIVVICSPSKKLEKSV
jgi:hypothetical protein